ncbi:MAG: hypothetical protein H7239_09835 [Flavobacterium sp.]|nr:hypothetical protein [Flavobacterium sp.]
MILKPKIGTDKLQFGMKQNDVISIIGNPDKQFNDDEKNIIFLYNELKLRLTFYEDEQFRFGYLISSNPDLVVFDSKIIGLGGLEVKNELIEKDIKSWEQEDFDSTENYFNESNWLTLQVEFGIIIRVEIGAIINDNDEFDWKFKG